MERSRCWGFQWLCVPVVAWVSTVMGCHGGDGRGLMVVTSFSGGGLLLLQNPSEGLGARLWESESESLGLELRREYASFIKDTSSDQSKNVGRHSSKISQRRHNHGQQRKRSRCVEKLADEHEICDGYLTEKEQQQLLLDEEALRETLEEEAMAEKESEERIKMLEEEARKEQTHDELFMLEFGMKSDSEYESD
nr:hypothetical protein [Tanacetum cinerariifolium]